MRHKWKSIGPFSQFAMDWRNAHKTRQVYECENCCAQKVFARRGSYYQIVWGFRWSGGDAWETTTRVPKCQGPDQSGLSRILKVEQKEKSDG